MQVPLPQPVNGIRAGRLRNKEPRRVKQETVVNAKFAADRRLDPEAEPDRV